MLCMFFYFIGFYWFLLQVLMQVFFSSSMNSRYVSLILFQLRKYVHEVLMFGLFFPAHNIHKKIITFLK